MECINPMRKKVNHSFKRHIDYKYDFCELCLYEIQKRNCTLPISNGNQVNKASYINHLTKSKPESDSLQLEILIKIKDIAAIVLCGMSKGLTTVLNATTL